jgi:hypothetical protein
LQYGDDQPEELTIQQDDVELSDAFEHEVAKLNPIKVTKTFCFRKVAERSVQKKYMLMQRRPTIYASDSKVGHPPTASDAQRVKAWRAVRKPSDMVSLVSLKIKSPSQSVVRVE